MNAGVSTVPCASLSRPRRALPAVPNKVNSAVMKGWSCVRVGRGSDEHGVTIAEKSVLPGDRVLVRREHGLAARERTHQHEQRGFRQMKVGHDCIDDPKAKAGHDEQR